jgi:adenine nucleotide transporter 17
MDGPGLLSGAVLDLAQAVSGSAGAVLSSAVVFPLDKFKARLQTGSTFAALAREAREARGLWRGAQPRLVEQACTKFSYFYFYSLLKTWCERRLTGGAKLGTLLNLCVGYWAAIANNGLTLPLQVLSTRIMVNKARAGGGLWAELVGLYREAGLAGLYRGWGPSVVLCINPAISFAAFEQLKLRILSRRGLSVNASISSFDAFALGAAAKALATIVTFPFIRVKTLMQVADDDDDDGGGGGGGGGGDGGSSSSDRSGPALTKVNAANKSIAFMLGKIWKAEGVRGLYVGVLPQLLKGVVASAVLFAAKERIFDLVVMLLTFANRQKRRRS